MSSETERDADRSDEDVALQLLKVCRDVGYSQVEAQKLVDRSIANRRKKAAERAKPASRRRA